MARDPHTKVVLTPGLIRNHGIMRREFLREVVGTTTPAAGWKKHIREKRVSVDTLRKVGVEDEFIDLLPVYDGARYFGSGAGGPATEVVPERPHREDGGEAGEIVITSELLDSISNERGYLSSEAILVLTGQISGSLKPWRHEWIGRTVSTAQWGRVVTAAHAHYARIKSGSTAAPLR